MSSCRHLLRRLTPARRLLLLLLALDGVSSRARAQLPPACPRQLAAALQPTPTGSSPAERANAPLVIVLELGDDLACALTTALDPWGLRIVQSIDLNPGSSMPSSSRAARELAERHGARAVVWLARDPQGLALWVYDADADRSWARPAPPAPFEASTAAALALSVKTVLRGAGLDPELAADARAPTRIEPAAAPPVLLDETSSPRVPALGGPSWQLGLSGGLRFGPLDTREPEARYALELRWWPGAHPGASEPSPPPASQPWLALAFESGVSAQVQSAGFDGEWLDLAPELGFGFAQRLGPRWMLGAGGAAALHITRLSGVTREPARAVEDVHLNPVLSARGELLFELGRTVLALQPGAELWVRRQRFLVADVPVADTGRAAARLMLALRLPLN